MNYWLLVIGILITVIAILDLMYTVLSPSGEGYISGKIIRWFWRGLLFISGYNGKSKLLNYSGPLILFSLILIWVLLIWIGNTLIFYSDPYSLINPFSNSYITSFYDTAYYTGYVLSSMGNGEYSPASDGWKIYVGLISYTGVIYMTLSISLLIPVVEAVSLKRIISLQVAQIGKNPYHMLKRHVKGGDLTELLNRLYPLKEELVRITQNHLTYPVIHYFHSSNKYESLPINLVCLDETVSLLLYGTEIQDENEKRKLEEIQGAFTYFLSTLSSAFVTPSDDSPEKPDVEEYLQGLDLKFSPLEYQSLETRRKLLLAYLQNDGWEWRDMSHNDEEVRLPPVG